MREGLALNLKYLMTRWVDLPPYNTPQLHFLASNISLSTREHLPQLPIITVQTAFSN
jgi:hypothetical protein